MGRNNLWGRVWPSAGQQPGGLPVAARKVRRCLHQLQNARRRGLRRACLRHLALQKEPSDQGIHICRIGELGNALVAENLVGPILKNLQLAVKVQ